MKTNHLPIQEQAADYQPYRKTYTFSSKGRASRVMGLKTNRIHHLQSDNQYRAFMIFEWSDKVIDIRESYPLIDVKVAIDDIGDIQWEKFRDKETGEEYVLTTTFLLTVNGKDKNKYVAISVRNTTELNKKVTLEHLEIERRYWHAKNIEWMIITEKQLDKQYVKNIEWARESLLENCYINKEALNKLEEFEIFLYECRECALKEILDGYEQIFNLKAGTALYMMRYLIAKKLISVDMYKKFDIKSNISEVIYFKRSGET